ncbi:MAG: META domain-containing protein [Moraxella sp.]|uniref:META domain-containing protein n=1 Tax=Moraxella sp. TaxID=479 RepID=UPI0026DBDCBF|nr:META domain-containing protein [Moraxella sp.]MDO4449486.1 META domain-containing protein [Moraxella sp.]
MMNIKISILLAIMLLSACTNHNQNSKNTIENDVNIANISKDNNNPPPALPTNDELLTSLKSNDWQKLALTYENISNQWRLIVVSDANFNNINLPIVKKDDFVLTFEKSVELNNYWVHMPNNCNTMNGEFILTKTGIKIQGNLPTTEIACSPPPKDLDDNIIHDVILNGDYEIYQTEQQHILKITHNHQYWLFIKNTKS